MIQKKIQKPAKIDKRYQQSKELEAVKDGLTSNPKSAAKVLLIELIARNAVIEKALFNRAVNDGLLTENGKLNPAVDKQMLKFQSAGKSALVELLKLGGNKSGEDGVENIFEDIFKDEDE